MSQVAVRFNRYHDSGRSATYATNLYVSSFLAERVVRVLCPVEALFRGFEGR